MFGTSGIRGPVGTEVTAELALGVGRAIGSGAADRVVVGRDVRDSGELLGDALTAGIRECGADVIDVGIEATPTIARSVSWLDADAGVVITASHNPAPDNGIKLWTTTGKAFGPSRRDAIADCIRSESFELEPWRNLGSREYYEGVDDTHVRALQEAVSVDEPPAVIVDVGNGAGAITARVLDDLGCSVQTLNGQQDGEFPGRPSEPTRENLETLVAVVERTDAQLGIAHDGDADRMLAVDETGSFVPKDSLLAVFACEAADAGDRVAAPIDTSMAVDDALSRQKASMTRTKVGDVYVAERTTEPDVVFGGEPSGAWIWPNETLCPDGPLAACKLVELVDNRGPLSSLVGEIATYPIRRSSIEVTEKIAVMERVSELVIDRYDDVETLDGVRVDAGDGWFLLRASGTQPLVRVTAEARDQQRMETLFDEAESLVGIASEEITE